MEGKLLGSVPRLPNPPNGYTAKAQRNETCGMVFRAAKEGKSSAELIPLLAGLPTDAGQPGFNQNKQARSCVDNGRNLSKISGGV